METTNRICIKCGSDIPPKRLEILPSTKTCVKCSDVQPKRGEVITKGYGDHTWNETIIFDSADDESLKRSKYEFTDKIDSIITIDDNYEEELEDTYDGEEEEKDIHEIGTIEDDSEVEE